MFISTLDLFFFNLQRILEIFTHNQKNNFEKWNIPCHISKQECHSHQRFPPPHPPTRPCELVSPEGTQEEEYLPSSSPETTATPFSEPLGAQDMNIQDTGPKS